MIDKQSETWVEVNAEISKESGKALELLLSRGLSHDESNYYRGYYAALMKIRGLESRTAPEKIQCTEY